MRVVAAAARDGDGDGDGGGGCDCSQMGSFSLGKQRLRFLLGDAKERGSVVILSSEDFMETERHSAESSEEGGEEKLRGKCKGEE